jgi:hypothetical protein
MKLITELTEDVSTLIEEDTATGKKRLYIEGVFMQAGIPNRNKRFYPRTVLENEVNRYISERVATRRAFGELNHPQSPVVNPERACIRICELKQDGNDFIGKALVLNTPMGDIVRGLLEGEGNIGVSSRGMGTLKKNGMITEVQNDFRLSTAADVVLDPSAPDAFVNGIMENVEWILDEKNGWQARDIVEETRKQMHKKVLNESERMKVFKRFVDSVTNLEIPLAR